MKPGWNAHVKVENATEVGLGWSITDDEHGKLSDYEAHITLTLPQGAGNATVVALKPNETVDVTRDASLTCGPNAFQAYATYNVTPNTGANGTKVKVQVCKHAGVVPPPARNILGGATGFVGQDIRVDVLIPGTCT